MLTPEAGITTERGTPGPSTIPRLIVIFFIIDLALGAAYLLNYWGGEPIEKVTKLLDLNGELSIAAWYSSTQYFCAFILAAIFAYGKSRQGGSSRLLLLLPILFLMMSIDEATEIHESLGRASDKLLAGGSREETSFHKTGIWMFLIGVPFLVLFLWFAHSLKRHLVDKPGSLRKLVLGMLIMLTGALGLELISNFIGAELRMYEILLEESFEMVGITIALWAVYEMAGEYLSTIGPRER